jgi:hypothetical protein
MRLSCSVCLLAAAIAGGCSSKSGARPLPGASTTVADDAGGTTATDSVPAQVVGGTGSCAAYVPPAASALPPAPKLPDPFLSPDGTRITSLVQWPCRRAEIRNQALTYELGPEPGIPASVSGEFDGSSKLTVTISDGVNAISFDAIVTLPATGTPPYPAMIGIGGISIGPAQLAAMGVATINFPNDVLAQQKDGSSRGKGLFYDFNPTYKATGAMVAWAWGVSRLIDAIEQTPAAMIDPTRLGVTGCSRNGKGALIVGALEERIVLTIPQESGSGGSASWRVSDSMLANGTSVQTLSEITQENVWFASSFSWFNNAATRLPFDHHMIEGLVAPRALLVIENTSQVWLGNVSTFTNSMTGHMIWEALGIPDHMGYSQVSVRRSAPG